MKTLIQLFIFPNVLIFSFSSCIVPESTHKESTFHLLTEVKGEANESNISLPNPSLDNLIDLNRTFYLRQIELPYYLQENRIIYRPESGKIEFREHERWGEPLIEGIGRVMGLNLSHMLGISFYSVYPHREKANTQIEIGITINRFEKVNQSEVLLDARWELFKKDFKHGSFPVLNGHEVILVEINASSKSVATSAEVLSLSETLKLISKKITIAIQSLEFAD